MLGKPVGTSSVPKPAPDGKADGGQAAQMMLCRPGGRTSSQAASDVLLAMRHLVPLRMPYPGSSKRAESDAI
jgi:hypothetical protein